MSLMVGHDTRVLITTGSGKSLRYQLPAALLRGRIDIVISPLFALIQDPMAQLSQICIQGEVLNSTMSTRKQAEIVPKGRTGRSRLLYLWPPERATGFRPAQEPCSSPFTAPHPSATP